MRALPLLLAGLVAACAAPKPVAVVRTVNVPVPLVLIKRVVVYEPRPADEADRALLTDYEATKPTVDAAVLKTNKPAAINRLVALDARARQSIREATRAHHTPTRADVAEAESRLSDLKAAALQTTP